MSIIIFKSLGDVFKLPVLSDQQSKTQKCSVYYHAYEKDNIQTEHMRSWNQKKFGIFAWKIT